jgi:hypothetical protein
MNIMLRGTIQRTHLTLKTINHYNNYCWPPLWSSSQSSWLQIEKFRVRFPALPGFLISRSVTGFTQHCEDSWGNTLMKSSGFGLEHRDWRPCTDQWVTETEGVREQGPKQNIWTEEVMKWGKGGENCILRSCMIWIPRQVQSVLSSKGGSGGRGM